MFVRVKLFLYLYSDSQIINFKKKKHLQVCLVQPLPFSPEVMEVQEGQGRSHKLVAEPSRKLLFPDLFSDLMLLTVRPAML